MTADDNLNDIARDEDGLTASENGLLHGSEELQNPDEDIDPSEEKKYARDFSIFRLSLFKDSFHLEKGVLQEQEVRYASIARQDTTFSLTPAIWKSQDKLDALVKLVVDSCFDQDSSHARLVVILPEEWGIIREVQAPDAASEEIRRTHITWATDLTGWEDDEKAHYNYLPLGDNTYRVIAVRDSLILLCQTFAEALGLKLMQVSLSSASETNILDDEPTKISPVEEETGDDLDFMPFEKKSRAVLIIPLIVVILAAAGYYLFGIQKIHQRFIAKSPVADVKEMPSQTAPETVKSADETTAEPHIQSAKTPPPPAGQESKPAQTAQIEPFSKVFNIFHRNVNVYHLSFTGDLIRSSFAASGSRKIDMVQQKLNESGIIHRLNKESSKESGNEYSAIITCRFRAGQIDSYTLKSTPQIKNILRAAGYDPSKTNKNYDIFTGSSAKISAILGVLDKNEILIYKIRVSQTAPNQYVLTLEY